MISFIICLGILIFGFIFYSRYIEKQFKPDDRLTPAITKADGVDYVALPKWRVFLIQLLNIAGLGPIWGAIGGALWGPKVFLWITFGTLFGGLIHDFGAGFISMRNDGKSFPELCGKFMGTQIQSLGRIFTIVLSFLLGVVLVKGPAGIISYIFKRQGMTDSLLTNEYFWVLIIVAYYFVATFLSIDKIIGKIYPVFGIFLLIMVISIAIGIFANGSVSNIPEIVDCLGNNMHPDDIGSWPMMFISVACGAVSGIHSAQCPLMARCLSKEKSARRVFCGAMAVEGIIALVWAAAACAVFPIVDGKMAGLDSAMVFGQSYCINEISTTTLGTFGAVLAMVGVIVCPITSGDTSFRTIRVVIADWFGIDQKNWKKRFLLTFVILLAAYITSHLDYESLWVYFASFNQLYAVMCLWLISEYLVKEKRYTFISIIPATFMTCVTATCVLGTDLYLGPVFGSAKTVVGYVGGVLFGVVFLALFLYRTKKDRQVIWNEHKEKHFKNKSEQH